jgi:hypothetical protein
MAAAGTTQWPNSRLIRLDSDSLLQNHFVVSAVKCFFCNGHHNRHNLYDIKNESFLCRLLQSDTKNCNLVSAAYVSRHEKSIFRNKKKSRTQIQAHRAYFQALLATVGDAKEEAVEPEPAIQTRGRACHRAPPPTCRGGGRLSRDTSRASPPAWPRSRSPKPHRLPSYDGVEGGGGVTLPLDANSVTVPVRQWWAWRRALRRGSILGRCAREIGDCTSTRGRRPEGRPRRQVGWVGSLSSAAHRIASSSSLRSPG